MFKITSDDQRALCVFNLGDAPATFDASGAKLQLFSVGGARLENAATAPPPYSALIAAL